MNDTVREILRALPSRLKSPWSFRAASGAERLAFARRWDPSATPTTCARESFFATLECEPLDRRRFPSQAEARMAVFEYLEGWYNPHRRHSALGYESPTNYERSQVPVQ